MTTLMNILTGSMQYDNAWAIYAERINGEFTAQSLARFGQRQFENGGTNDNCELFANNEYATDQMNLFLEGTPDEDKPDFAVDAADYLIDKINEENQIQYTLIDEAKEHAVVRTKDGLMYQDSLIKSGYTTEWWDAVWVKLGKPEVFYVSGYNTGEGELESQIEIIRKVEEANETLKSEAEAIQKSLDAIVTIAEAAEEYGINEDTMRKIAQTADFARKSGATHLIHRKSLETYLLSPHCEVYQLHGEWAVITPAHSLIYLTKAQAWQIAFQYGRSDARYQAAIKAANVPTTPDVDMGN